MPPHPRNPRPPIPTAPQALPGLRLWALENVAGQCCIGSLLGGAALDVRDAGVWQLTSEVAVSLRSLRKALGVALSEALRGTLLPAVGVRGEEAERVVAATEGEDTRALRTALRGLMMARQGEGGSGRAGGGG